MAITDTVSVNVDPDIKRRAEEVFEQLGITASEAVSLFYEQVLLHRALPFFGDQPTETTAKALAEAKDREKLASFDTPEELYEDLGI